MNSGAAWLIALSRTAGKGVVNNIDGRALGRIGVEIDRLETKVAELRAALAWALSDVEANARQDFAPDDPVWNDIKRARALLAKLEE